MDSQIGDGALPKQLNLMVAATFEKDWVLP